MAEKKGWIWAVDLNGNKLDVKYNIKDFYKLTVLMRSSYFYQDETTRFLVIGHLRIRRHSESPILAVCESDAEARKYINDYFKTR